MSSDTEKSDLSDGAETSSLQSHEITSNSIEFPASHSDSPDPWSFRNEYDKVELEYFEIAGGPFFHGTSRRAARKILKEGFKDWSWTAKNPNLSHLAKQGIARWIHDGAYGRGTYVTRNWRVSLFFGPVLFRVSLQPGTRILRLDVPPDTKVLGSLRREFGKEILTQPPWKVLPRNKHLTLNEAIALARYHVKEWLNSKRFPSTKRTEMHEQGMRDLRKILVRYRIQGWGEPSDLSGIVIFATDRIQVSEVVLSIPRNDLLSEFMETKYVQERYPSLEAFAQQCRRSPNRANAVTRKWVDEANQQLFKSAALVPSLPKTRRTSARKSNGAKPQR